MKAARAIDPLYEVISIAFGRASLEDLAALSSTSSRCRRLVRIFVRANIHLVLMKLTRASVLEPQQKQIEAIRWLSKAAGTRAVQSICNQLVIIPRVPAAVAQVLLDGGLRISYDQLVAAARARVPGVEAFVRSHTSGLVAEVEAICSNSRDELKLLLPLLPPEDLPDLLHIALNALNPSAAVQLLDYLQSLPEELEQMKQRHAREQREAPSQRRRGLLVLRQGRLQLPPPVKQLRQEHELQQRQLQERHLQLQQQLTSPGLLDELLLTAAVRGHALLVSLLLKDQGGSFSQQQLQADTAEAAVRLAVQRKSSAILLTLCQSNAVQQLPASSIVDLMQLAVQRQYSGPAFARLCHLPGAQQIPARDLSGLLKQAVHLQDSMAVDALSRLPNAADISSSSAVAMLEEIGLTGNHNTIKQLVALPASQLITPHQLGHLLRLAMQHNPNSYNNTVIMQCLTSLQAVQLLSAGILAELFEAALQSNNTSCLRTLCTAPATANIPASQVAGLLKTALERSVHTGTSEAFLQVVQLPAAQNIAAEELGQLLLMAMQKGPRTNLAVVQKLCGLTTPAQQLQPGLVEQLLHRALLLQLGSVATLLSRLPTVSQLDSNAISDLLKAAVDVDDAGLDGSLVTTLTSQPAAQELTPAQLRPLLQVTVQRRECGHVARLCVLPGAGQLPPDSLAELMALQLESRGDCDCVLDALIGLAAAEELSAEHIAELLATALQHRGNTELFSAVESLCSLPNASSIQPGPAMAEVLRSAIIKLDDEFSRDADGQLQTEPLPHVAEICELPGAQGLAAETVTGLLQLAVQLDKSCMVLHLSELPAAAEIGREVAANLLQQAVRLGRSRIIRVLCGNAAKALNAQQLVPCISSALNSCYNKQALQQLLSVTAAQQLSAGEVGSLMRTAVKAAGDSALAVELLAKVPAAAGIPASEMYALLRTAIQSDKHVSVKQVCSMQAAAQLSASSISTLLDLAEQQGSVAVRQPLTSLLLTAADSS